MTQAEEFTGAIDSYLVTRDAVYVPFTVIDYAIFENFKSNQVVIAATRPPGKHADNIIKAVTQSMSKHHPAIEDYTIRFLND